MRDYRYPNSQTYDAPWRSPNASAVLNRTQKGAIHSTLHYILGFTQLGIDEKTADILQLACRRGILRPKAFFFGSKKASRGWAPFRASWILPLGICATRATRSFLQSFWSTYCFRQGFEDDTDDSIVERHMRHCECFFAQATNYAVQFKLTKYWRAQTHIQLWGLMLDDGTRQVDPEKAQGLRYWPDLLKFMLI